MFDSDEFEPRRPQDTVSAGGSTFDLATLVVLLVVGLGFVLTH